MPQTNADELRPRSFDEYVGQNGLKARLRLAAHAAVRKQRPFPHTLLVGPPGVGKTSLGALIADAVHQRARFEVVQMPFGTRKTMERWARDASDHGGGVYLFDELHRCKTGQQEELLPVLNEGYFTSNSGQKIMLPGLTIIGATTEDDDIIASLKRRFLLRPSWESYSDDDLTLIVQGMAVKAGFVLPHDDAEILGRACAGMPGNAREFITQAEILHACDEEPRAMDVLGLCETDPDGLKLAHRKYLAALRHFGGTAGLKPVCDFLQINDESARSLERLLRDRGLITYSDRGRELTTAGMKRLRV